MKILAAMSGGVDSAMAAALAVEAGHEVVGVHMALLRKRQLFREGTRGCCSIEDSLDARRVCDKLGIPFYVWDLSQTFADTVVEDFLSEYRAGRTPNPCIRCNEHVKFNTLANRAASLGFDGVATGHYARVVDGQLHRGKNVEKDQSYVLAVAGPNRLAHSLFPLGDFRTKDDVRSEAARRGFAVSNKPDSFDICFIPDGDTAGFLRTRLGAERGLILDTSGKPIGEHDGAFAYTVGQRKGLNLGNPAADGKPRYVLKVDVANNQVIVGSKDQLAVSGFTAGRPVWYVDEPTDGDPIFAGIQVRAHGREIPARITTDGAVVHITLIDDALMGLAAGQSVVAYQGTQVILQATID